MIPKKSGIFFGLWLVVAAASSGWTQSVVINEFHYDPADPTQPLEFVELYNTTAAPINIAGWKFDSGVDYVFPGGATIPANGYVVVAQNPTAFQTAYGFLPFGPWTGKLSNSGERIRLRTGANVTIDDITYGIGFPWPTAAHGEGSSVELINPALDNSRPGSWRASGAPVSSGEAQVYIAAEDDFWHYRKGTSEASSPTSAWRQLGFIEDGTWLEGQTSVGFGDGDDNTFLNDMEDNYTSIFLRRVFNVTAGQIPDELRLRVRVDDGCVVWINGTEVARFHVAAGNLAYNAVAQNHEADIVDFEEVILTNASSYLVAGDNVIAIHALNSSIGSSDFSIDAQLLEYREDLLPDPTPGVQNSVFSTTAPPSIDNVVHSPAAPLPGQNVTVTARVLDPDGISSVTLGYQAVLPGSYIRRTDATFETTWTNLSMVDNGTAGDAVAGDSIYTAVIPGSVQTHRKLVRYRITMTDSAANAITVPYADDGQLNFAYFVYNGAPSWSGAFDPGVTAVQAFDFTNAALSGVPTYHIIGTKADVDNCQYNSSFSETRFWGTLVYNGVVYDHVQYNVRGEGSTYLSGKNKWRVHFNTSRDFVARDNRNQPYVDTWDTLNLNGCSSAWAALNRGMAGLDEAIPFRLYELAGVPSSKTHYVHLRVIDDASDGVAGTQYQGGNPSGITSGDFWGLYLAIEHPDGSFIDERGLPDGNIYKIESNNGDRKHQGETQPSDGSDWTAFRNAHVGSGNNPTEAWWRANLDMDAYYSFLAVSRLVGNVDLRSGSNHFYYHRPTDNRWVLMPWDLDMMYIAMTHWGSNIFNGTTTTWYPAVLDAHKSILQHPALALEYRNRAREVLDLMASDPAANGGQIGQLADEYAQIVNPTGAALTWADADAFMWNKNPRTHSTGSAKTTHFGNFFKTPYTDNRNPGLPSGVSTNWVRTLVSSDHEGFVQYIKDYVTNTYPGSPAWTRNNGDQRGYGYQHVLSEIADAAIPDRPTITYVGLGTYPLNDLRFTTSAFSDPQGTGSFSAIQWRIAEISAPGIPLYNSALPRIYEIADVWRSAEINSYTGESTINGTSLVAGHTYRVRCRHKDNTGRWSRWSEAVQFVTGAADLSYLENLVVTEVMYNSTAPTTAEQAQGFTDAQSFDFIELKNISGTALDLSNITFTGITFTFTPGASLAPGAYGLIVKDPAAFNFRYGAGKPILGTYTGNIANGGEQITLALGTTTFWSFTYGTSSPWPPEANGGGYSLVLIDPDSNPDPAIATNWRASRKLLGSAGASDTISYVQWALDYPGVGALLDDDDADGMKNLLEYGVGSSPLQNSLPPAAAVTNLVVESVSSPYLTLSFRRQIGATDLVYAVEFSTDLINPSGWAATGVLVSSTLNGDGTVTELWRSAQPITSGTKLFVRLKVESP
jgi:hypothetical protein